jgi:FtsP/CotA-like multicopper oxidase with cupredoxin domain
MHHSFALVFFVLLFSVQFMLRAAEVQPPVINYTLTIAETVMKPAESTVRALTVNGGIPGPTLRFRVGDRARILVRNDLVTEETSIHWHGLLVPNLQDGVPYVTTPPIPPGGVRTFEFPLTHSGTYWYHSHTGLQEQRGVYGAIVIEPREPSAVHVDQEEVLVLSDWTDESPTEVIRTLMRGSDWYAIRKGTAQSVFGAIAAGNLTDYLNREKARLPPMDVSDVAYDAFLVNGKRTLDIPAKPGAVVRLRVINAATSTYFYLESATGPLQLIANDGNDIVPIRQKRLLIGMAETYDLLITVPATGGSYELRATSQDTTGYSSTFIGAGERHTAPTMARLNPYSMNQTLAAILDQIDETEGLTDDQALAEEKERPLPPYKRLKSPTPTALPSEAPVRVLKLNLTGDMMRYVWSINGETITENSTIPVTRGEILRLELVNDTMMHHPMHLHGHFFRLLMPGGADPRFAPLKHTVDVPPMSRRTIEFYANEDRDWLFHCHLLYHHHAGMGRVFSYSAGTDPTHTVKLESSDQLFPMVDGSLQSQMSMGMATLMDARNNYTLSWKAGWGEVDSQDDLEGTEYEVDLTWQRYINPRWMAFAGVRATNMMDDRGHLVETNADVDLFDATEGRLIAGAMYRLPYNIDTTLSLESSGDARMGISRTVPLTSRLNMTGRGEYDTNLQWMWMVGAGFTVSKNFILTVSYDSDYGVGGGLGFRF